MTMNRTLRKLISASAALLVFISITDSPGFGQSTASTSSTPISTTQQNAQSLGNYAIIPLVTPGKAKSGDSSTAGSASSTGAAASQIANVGDRSQPRDRNAPRRESMQAFRVAGKHINALLNGFDQGAGFGFGVEFTTADSIPGVEFRAKLLTSTRLYRRFEGEMFFPNLGDEKTKASVWFNYVRRTQDNFFGIGPRTAEDPETNFATEERSYNALLYHDFVKGVQAGIYARVSNIAAYRGEDDNDIAIDTLFSNNPAVTPVTLFLPGLHTNAKVFSYGAFTEIDLRNNERGLPKGAYGYARIASFDGLKNDFFDDFGWTEIELDGRVYIPIGSDSTSLALRAYTDLKDPKKGSQIPFYEQAFLGGRSFLRGFRNYRFRGNNALLFSVEPRQTVWKQEEDRGLDVIVFGDGGQVWGDNRSQTNPLILANDKFASENWRFSMGGGLQYRWNRSLAVRIELGHSNESNMVFFSLSRGF